MDWFERVTGFPEREYAQTKRRLRVLDGRLQNERSGRGYAVGDFSLPSLAELRAQSGAAATPASGEACRVRIVRGDVRDMHAAAENRGALFQVASQSNALEMSGPTVSPEHGVTRYEYDLTQGPACALAAGAATIFRNYLLPLTEDGRQLGQTSQRQVDAFADLHAALSREIAAPSDRRLWEVRNGYVLASERSLRDIGTHLRALRAAQQWEALDALRGALRVGVHADVEVTDAAADGGGDGTPFTVSQVFCSALPLAYSEAPAALWEPLARLVLEAAYEATMHAALLNMRRARSRRVLLTLLGGGAFGNPEAWIVNALRRATRAFDGHGLEVLLVCYFEPSPALLAALYADDDAAA